MSAADGIRKLGFHRWYERQLIEAHACLVTAFLSTILVAVCLDQFRWRDSGIKSLIMLGLVIAGAILCFKTVRAYFRMLFRAEAYARQSVCQRCKAYGALHVLTAGEHALNRDESEQGDEAGDRQSWLRVRCRKCGYDWPMQVDADQ